MEFHGVFSSPLSSFISQVKNFILLNFQIFKDHVCISPTVSWTVLLRLWKSCLNRRKQKSNNITVRNIKYFHVLFSFIVTFLLRQISGNINVKEDFIAQLILKSVQNRDHRQRFWIDKNSLTLSVTDKTAWTIFFPLQGNNVGKFLREVNANISLWVYRRWLVQCFCNLK